MHLFVKRLAQLLGVVMIILACPWLALAHPMPSSRVLLDLQATGVAAEVQLPLGELQLALGQ